jgi:hypothetical protein
MERLVRWSRLRGKHHITRDDGRTTLCGRNDPGVAAIYFGDIDAFSRAGALDGHVCMRCWAKSDVQHVTR